MGSPRALCPGRGHKAPRATIGITKVPTALQGPLCRHPWRGHKDPHAVAYSPMLCDLTAPHIPIPLLWPCSTHGPIFPVPRPYSPHIPHPQAESKVPTSPRCVPFYSDQRAAAAAITDIRDQLLHLLLLLGTPTTGGERAGDGDPGATRPHRGRGHLHRGRATERLGPGACREGHADRAGHRGAGGDAAHHEAPRAAAGHGHPGPGRPRAPRHPPAPHLRPLAQNGAAAGPQPASAAHHALPERPHRGR